MSNPTHILSSEELAAFNTDEGRSKIRAEVASRFLSSETVTLLLPSLQPIDQVIGLISDGDSDFAVEVTPEEREAKIAEAARLEEEVKRLEVVVRPECMRRLRVEARAEVRQELREKTNEVLQLRARLSKYEIEERAVESRHKGEAILLRAENTRLKAELSKLKRPLPPGASR